MGRCVNIVKKYERSQDEKKVALSSSVMWWNFHSRRHPAQTRIVMRHSVDCGGADESSISLHWKRVFFFFAMLYFFSTIKHPLVSGSLIGSRSIDMQIVLEKRTLSRTQQFSYFVWKNALKINRLTATHIWHIEMCVIFDTTAAVTSAIRCTLDSLLAHFFSSSNFLNLFSLSSVRLFGLQ